MERSDIKKDNLDHDDSHLRDLVRFEQISREAGVKTITGLPSTKCFKCIFDHLFPKAQHMQYWRGPKQTTREGPQDYGDPGIVLPKYRRPGPGRKLDLEQEFLLTLMMLKLGLINEDLAFRFMVSSTTVSSVFIKWIKLVSKELSVLIFWPSKQQVKKTASLFQETIPKSEMHNRLFWLTFFDLSNQIRYSFIC